MHPDSCDQAVGDVPLDDIEKTEEMLKALSVVVLELGKFLDEDRQTILDTAAVMLGLARKG